MQEDRAEAYEEAADIIIDTDGKTPETIVSEIIGSLGIE